MSTKGSGSSYASNNRAPRPKRNLQPVPLLVLLLLLLLLLLLVVVVLLLLLLSGSCYSQRTHAFHTTR